MNGREVCKSLKADSQTSDIPVIFLTAKDSEADVSAEKEVGAVGHVLKPVNFDILREEIDKII